MARNASCRYANITEKKSLSFKAKIKANKQVIT